MGISLLTQDGATATTSPLPTSFIIRTKKLEKFRLGSGGHSTPSHLYKIVPRASVEPQPSFSRVYIDLSYTEDDQKPFKSQLPSLLATR